MDVNTLGKQLMFSTVRISCEKSDGIRSATGFLLNASTVPGVVKPVLMTNKHVIEGAKKFHIMFLETDPADGDKPNPGVAIQVTLTPDELPFTGHPDTNVDVTAAMLQDTLSELEDVNVYFYPLPLDLLPDQGELESFDAIEDVVFIGYPDGWSDPRHYTPFTRRGITATPLFIDFAGLPSFFIDASVFGGSSGSPVFIYDRVGYSNGKGEVVLGTRLHLVGILAGGAVKPSEFRLSKDNASYLTLDQDLNLGHTFGARAIRETLEALAKEAASADGPEAQDSISA